MICKELGVFVAQHPKICPLAITILRQRACVVVLVLVMVGNSVLPSTSTGVHDTGTRVCGVVWRGAQERKEGHGRGKRVEFVRIQWSSITLTVPIQLRDVESEKS